MTRTLTPKNLYDKKFKTFPFDGVWLKVMGTPSTSGCWILYGQEKHGKSTMGLLTADYMRKFERVWYISGEEGTDYDFVQACSRANISHNAKGLHFSEFQSLEDIRTRLGKKHSQRIVILDNATIYNSEIKSRDWQKLLQDFPEVLFILIAHEERNEPYTALAKFCKKLAKIIIRVQGLACSVSGRCPGGTLIINEEKAALYHSQEILNAE